MPPQPVVSDYIPGVVQKLGGRSDIAKNGQAAKWIVEAVRNLSQNYPFVDLQVVGPTFTLNTGQYIYPLSQFVNGEDEIGFFDVIWIWYNGATSGPGTVLKYRTPPVLESLIQNTINGGSNPIYWTRYGSNLRIGPVPAQTGYGYALYQKKHPFSVNGFDYSNTLEDPVLLPSEWREVIEYAAAIKGAPEVQMAEMVQVWQQLLYGDPTDKSKPGIIRGLVSQFSRDGSLNERQLNMVVQ